MSSGGLLQIITSGKQDVHLTVNPEITFFKKVYKKYSNFSMELKEIISDQSIDYGSLISFTLNYGDAIHRCYLEVELPLLTFSDKYITNEVYNKKKIYDINYYTQLYNSVNTVYTNLKTFIDIEMVLYRDLCILLQSDDISLLELQNLVYTFENNNSNRRNYINIINDNIYKSISISSYILSLNTIETKETITNILYKKYTSMIYYLKKYNAEKKIYYDKINDINKNLIKWAYTDYLGHNYCKYFSIDIGGREIQKYNNDIYHIHQMHRIDNQHMNNYNKMIGNTPDINEFNNKPKGGNIILIPLIFWFNNESGLSLPLVSLQYSPVVINIKINEIENIITFENYSKEYDDLLIVKKFYNDEFNINFNTSLIYKTYTIDNNIITYNCLLLNEEALLYNFPDLLKNEIDIILSEGKLYSSTELYELTGKYLSDQYILTKNDWISLMINIKNIKYSNFAYKIAGYYPYIDFNVYYSLIDKPKIKLICESIFFEDNEREKFANNELEYIIEEYKEDVFDIANNISYDCELSFAGLCKELYWYVQPSIYKNKLLYYGQNLNLLFAYDNLFKTSIIENQKLLFDQCDVLINDNNINYYTFVLSYKYFTNILVDGVYYKNFGLYPEQSQPSGTINLKYIKSKQFILNFNSLFIDEYTNFLIKCFGNNYDFNKNIFLLKFIASQYTVINISNGKFNVLL